MIAELVDFSCFLNFISCCYASALGDYSKVIPCTNISHPMTTNLSVLGEASFDEHFPIFSSMPFYNIRCNFFFSSSAASSNLLKSMFSTWREEFISSSYRSFVCCKILPCLRSLVSAFSDTYDLKIDHPLTLQALINLGLQKLAYFITCSTTNGYFQTNLKMKQKHMQSNMVKMKKRITM